LINILDGQGRGEEEMGQRREEKRRGEKGREEKRTGMNLIEYVENVKVENGKVKLKEKRRG
jgi:hypothetical protein